MIADWTWVAAMVGVAAAGGVAGWYLPGVARAYEQLLRQGLAADATAFWRACTAAWSCGTGRDRVSAANSPGRRVPAGIRWGAALAVAVGLGLLLARHGLFSVAFVLYAGLLAGLVLLALIDYLTGLLPDAVLAPLTGLGLIGLAGGWTVPPMQAVLAAVLAGSLLAAARALVTHLSGREALGWGDVKLFVMLGLWLGIQTLFSVLLLANLMVLAAGVMHRPRPHGAAERPFGPFVALAFLVTLATELNAPG